MKNYPKDKPKEYTRFTMAVKQFLTYYQYRTNNPSDIYTLCGCEHYKLRWKEEILSGWNQLTHGFKSHK